MSEIKVPDGMLKAAMASRMSIKGQIAPWSEGMCLQVLEAALRWLSENPIVPTYNQLNSFASERTSPDAIQWFCAEWQRRMFLAPDHPEIPEEVKDLQIDINAYDPVHKIMIKHHNEDVIEAFRRGQKSVTK